MRELWFGGGEGVTLALTNKFSSRVISAAKEGGQVRVEVPCGVEGQVYFS